MSETDKKLAEEVWRVARQQPAGQDVIDYIAAALAKARQEGRREGIRTMRDFAIEVLVKAFEEELPQTATQTQKGLNDLADFLLAEGEKK